MTSRAIVLDANILIRAVLGSKVSELLAAHAERISFLAPDTAFDEAREHLPVVLLKRGTSREAVAAALEKLDALATIVWPVPASAYGPLQDTAQRGSAPGMRTTGRYLRARLRQSAPSGPKTATSSAPGWAPGRPVWSICISRCRTRCWATIDRPVMNDAAPRLH